MSSGITLGKSVIIRVIRKIVCFVKKKVTFVVGNIRLNADVESRGCALEHSFS